MYVTNDTNRAILYTAVGGGVGYGTILPGQGREIGGEDGVENISFSTDEGEPLPGELRITLALH